MGGGRSAALGRRVEELTASRSGVIDAAAVERRRIQRDLRNETQQRLTSLSVNLGIALATNPDLPPAVRETVAQAHEQAKQSLVELRDLIRGIHPEVLDERGLDAALSGLAACTPLPVRLRVDVRRRAPRAVEAVAYAVVAEALANAVRHARAGLVEVVVELTASRLRVTVRDDGCGGARLSAGSGLRGAAQRARSVDGTLQVHSPPGGPTTIVADLPC